MEISSQTPPIALPVLKSLVSSPESLAITLAMHSAHWAPEDKRRKYFFICPIAMTSKLEMTLLLDFQRQRCYSSIKVTSNINVSLVLE